MQSLGFNLEIMEHNNKTASVIEIRDSEMTELAN